MSWLKYPENLLIVGCRRWRRLNKRHVARLAGCQVENLWHRRRLGRSQKWQRPVPCVKHGDSSQEVSCSNHCNNQIVLTLIYLAVALRGIRKYQRSTDLLIPKLPFQRVIEEVLLEIQENLGDDINRMQATAVMALQEATESLLATFFESKYPIIIAKWLLQSAN